MPPAYCIRIERWPLKALGSLPKRQRTSIRKVVDSLVENPWPPDVREPINEQQLYRILAGNHRVVYQILDKDQLVLIVKIGDRKEIYW